MFSCGFSTCWLGNWWCHSSWQVLWGHMRWDSEVVNCQSYIFMRHVVCNALWSEHFARKYPDGTTLKTHNKIPQRLSKTIGILDRGNYLYDNLLNQLQWWPTAFWARRERDDPDRSWQLSIQHESAKCTHTKITHLQPATYNNDSPLTKKLLTGKLFIFMLWINKINRPRTQSTNLGGICPFNHQILTQPATHCIITQDSWDSCKLDQLPTSGCA